MSTMYGGNPLNHGQDTGETADSAEAHGADRLTLDSGLTVRPWQEGDDLALLEVWGDPENIQHHHDRAVLRPSSNNPWSRCVVAEDDGVPVAAAVLLQSSVHPSRLSFYAEVAQEHRRKGVASQLLEILEAEAANCGITNLKARCAPHTAAQCFLKDNGFTKIQRSRDIVISPGSMKLPDFEGTGLELEDIATGSVELTQLVVDFYNAIHTWDPAEMTLGRAQQALLGETSGASGVVVLRDQARNEGGRILAFAISYTAERSEDPTDVLLGWNPELGDEQAECAVRALLAMLVHRYPVKTEVDESMVPLKRVIDDLIEEDDAEIQLETLVYVRDAEGAPKTADAA